MFNSGPIHFTGNPRQLIELLMTVLTQYKFHAFLETHLESAVKMGDFSRPCKPSQVMPGVAVNLCFCQLVVGLEPEIRA